MTQKARLDRLTKRLTPRPPAAGPLNVFYVAVAPGEPTGETAVWGGIGREVRYAAGTTVPRLHRRAAQAVPRPRLRGLSRPAPP